MLRVFTNGCFDLLHAGHIHCIKQIKKAFPESHLIIGINSDKSVSSLKGNNRPIVDQNTRKMMMENIKGVDEVHIFDEPTPNELIMKLVPDVVVKGEDYYMNEVVGFDTATCGIFIVKHLKGFSTTQLIKKVNKSL
jgi:rfaE bifunctional protein nucleotidyltransferase chain/domain